jgi:Arc/MetJ-type ribon-helix-helix transcriptional regulator
MNVRLKPEVAKFIDEQVKAGRYPSAEDAINAVIDRARTEELLLLYDELTDDDVAAIEEGLAQADRGEGRPWEEVRAELKAKYLGR